MARTRNEHYESGCMIHISVAQYAVRSAYLIRIKDIDAGSIPQNAE